MTHGARACDPAVERGKVSDTLVLGAINGGGGVAALIGCGGAQGFFYLAGEGAKLHFPQEADQGFRIGIGQAKVIQGFTHRSVDLQGNEIAGDTRIIGMSQQFLPASLLLDLARTL